MPETTEATTETKETQATAPATEEPVGRVEDLLGINVADEPATDPDDETATAAPDEAKADEPAEPASTEEPAAAAAAAEPAQPAQPAAQPANPAASAQIQRNNAKITALRERLKPLQQKLKDGKYDSFDDGQATAEVMIETVGAVLDEIDELQGQNERLSAAEARRAEQQRAADFWTSDFQAMYPGVDVAHAQRIFKEEQSALHQGGLRGTALDQAASVNWRRRMDAIKAKQAQPVKGETKPAPPAKAPVTPGGAAVLPSTTTAGEPGKVTTIEDELAKGGRGRYAGVPGF
jgi:hypothetical protein